MQTRFHCFRHQPPIHKFSIISLILLALLFGTVGVYILYQIFAPSPLSHGKINGNGAVNVLNHSLPLSPHGTTNTVKNINSNGSVTSSATVAVTSPGNVTSAHQIELAILSNIRQNGFDSNTAINGGLGGLWINWRTGISPLQTNFNGTSHPDGTSVSPPRHDPLTDIRYLHALWLYKTANPSDSQWDGEINKYTQIVKYEWANAGDQERGWLYDEEFRELHNLTNDPFYQQQMINLAHSYVRAVSNRSGIYYKTSSTHLQGYYRPEDALEVGLALIQAGIEFHNTTWQNLGQNDVNFVYQHAYISQYHTFAEEMDQVLTPSGTVNPAETFYIDVYKNYTIYGNEVRSGSIAQIVLSLLNTYTLTNNPDFLNKATDLLSAVSINGSLQGLWDRTNLGYFEDAAFSGTTAQNPGAVTLNTGKKEAGRQLLMLWAYHVANGYKNNVYANMETAMQQVALYKAYYQPDQGVLYEMRPDWSLVQINGITENWVTTEAMGCELEALLETVH